MDTIVFSPGANVKAEVVFNISPSGLSVDAELFLSNDGGLTKAASGGRKPFSTGPEVPIFWDIIIPPESGIYKAYIEVHYPVSTGPVVLRYSDLVEIAVVSGNISPIDWT